MNGKKQIEEKVFDILNKLEFMVGQRAGRELWFDKPREVQDQDIANFVKDINYIRDYLQNNVVLTREEYIDLSRNYVGEQIAQARKKTAMEIYRKADEICTGSQNDGDKILAMIKDTFGLEVE